jgi:hypothetical protein
MPTAVAKSKAKEVKAETAQKIVTAEERTRIKQQREKLGQELAHCQENYDIAAAALEAAADPDKDPEEYMMCHRDFTILRKKLSAKQAEIEKHRTTFLTDEEIETLDREERETKEHAAREAARLEKVKPHAEELARHFHAFRDAVRYFQKLPARVLPENGGAPEIPFSNAFSVNEMAHVLIRNLGENDPKYKICITRWGGDLDKFEEVVKNAAH